MGGTHRRNVAEKKPRAHQTHYIVSLNHRKGSSRPDHGRSSEKKENLNLTRSRLRPAHSERVGIYYF